MPFVRSGTKRAARHVQRTWLLGLAEFELLARILATVPQAVFGSGASDLIAIPMGYFAAVARSVADDPPRRDYTTATRARRRTLPAARVGTSGVEQLARVFADASSVSASYLSAFVRALERSQAAEHASRSEALGERLMEADAYAGRAVDSIWQTSEQAVVLAQALRSDTRLRRTAINRVNGPEGERLLAAPYWQKLGSRALTLFREAAVDPLALASAWDERWPDDPIGSCAKTLHEAVDAANALANELRNWGPVEEQSEPPGFYD